MCFEKILFALIISICPHSYAIITPDEPLIFTLESKNGTISCLIAANHRVIKPAEITPFINNCRNKAKAIVVETNINILPANIWTLYERNSTDLSVMDLKKITLEKINVALRKERYTEEEIIYLLKLQPVAIYRKLLFSKSLSSKISLLPNIDIEFTKIAHSDKNINIIELEGYNGLFKAERDITIDQIDVLISCIADLILDEANLMKYLLKQDEYIKNSSAQPNLNTARDKKYLLDTEGLGLPSFSINFDSDKRNTSIGNNLLSILEKEESLLIFLGPTHVGGYNSVLKKLIENNIKVTRIK